jgi:hypothetical protein
MTTICTHCWATCDTEESTEDMINFMTANDETDEVSSCCLAEVLVIDEEDLEEIAEEIETSCFTFDEALERYGNIAFYIAENLVYVPEYEEN